MCTQCTEIFVITEYNPEEDGVTISRNKSTGFTVNQHLIFITFVFVIITLLVMIIILLCF